MYVRCYENSNLSEHVLGSRSVYTQNTVLPVIGGRSFNAHLYVRTYIGRPVRQGEERNGTGQSGSAENRKRTADGRVITPVDVALFSNNTREARSKRR